MNTPAEFEASYAAALQKLTPEERLARTLSLSAMVRSLVFAGVQRRHPNASSENQRLHFASALYGRDFCLTHLKFDPQEVTPEVK